MSGGIVDDSAAAISANSRLSQTILNIMANGLILPAMRPSPPYLGGEKH